MPDGRSSDAIVIDDHGLGALISLLQSRGYATRGPVLRDQAIVHGDIGEVGDLPIGCHDTQAPGSYRVERGDDREFFGWAVGPQSLKGDFFSARATVWHATSGPDGPEELVSERPAAPPLAFVGARPCELAAAAVLDGAHGYGSNDFKIPLARRTLCAVLAEATRT